MDYFQCDLVSVRRNKGFSKKELAAMVRTTERTIDKIEAGDFVPSLYLAMLIAYALDVNINDIWKFVV